MKLEHSIIHKNKFKMDYRPKYKFAYYKFLERNIDWTLSDIKHSNIFSDPLPRKVKTK